MQHPAALALAALLASAANAQPDSQPNSQTDARAAAESAPADQPPAELNTSDRAPSFAATVDARYIFESDFDTGPGDLSLATVGVGFSATFHPADRHALTLGIDAAETWYDFNNATGLDASGDPFDNATTADLYARYAAPLHDNTSWFALASVGFAGESGAEFSDSIVYTGALGFTVKQSDTLTWGLGVAVRTRLEEDALVIPLPQIHAKLSERWTLATERAGVRLEYAATDAVSYGLTAEYDSKTFRLDDAGPIPSGVATDRRVPVAFFARYRPDRSIDLTAQVGASLFSNIELFDAVGNELTDDDTDTAFFAGIGARIRF